MLLFHWRFVKHLVPLTAHHVQNGVKHIAYILDVENNVERYAHHVKRFEIDHYVTVL